jgi:hypothetical protein
MRSFSDESRLAGTQGFSLRRIDRTPQTAFPQAAGANPRRTLLIGREALLGNKRAIYGWKIVNMAYRMGKTVHSQPLHLRMLTHCTSTVDEG